MKQIPILSGKAMIVEMPDGAINPHIYPGSNDLWYKYKRDKGGFSYKRCELPPGDWHVIGLLSEMREMDAIPLVDKERFIVDGPDLGFRNYKGNKYDWFGTALESLESAIEAKGWYFENPVKVHTWASENADNYIKQWEEGKKRVLDRSRCLLLRRDG